MRIIWVSLVFINKIKKPIFISFVCRFFAVTVVLFCFFLSFSFQSHCVSYICCLLNYVKSFIDLPGFRLHFPFNWDYGARTWIWSVWPQGACALSANAYCQGLSNWLLVHIVTMPLVFVFSFLIQCLRNTRSKWHHCQLICFRWSTKSIFSLLTERAQCTIKMCVVFISLSKRERFKQIRNSTRYILAPLFLLFFPSSLLSRVCHKKFGNFLILSVIKWWTILW